MNLDTGTSSQKEPQYVNPDVEMSTPDMDDSSTPNAEKGSDQQVEPTTGAGDMSHTDGTSSNMAAIKKSNRKARDPNKLHQGKIAITVVGPSGEPVTLEDAAKRYSKMLGCILRTVPTSSKDLVRHKENLLLALNRSYEFPSDVKKLGEESAMSKWPKMFRLWKSSARCNLVGKDFETIKRLNPTMDHEDWTKFCESSGSESRK